MSLERFRRSLKRLREHHKNCERRLSQGLCQQVQDTMTVGPTQLDSRYEQSESGCHESEFSSHAGSDDDSSDLLSTEKRPDPCREDGTSDIDAENPMSTSQTVPHKGRERAVREVDDDQSPGTSLSQRFSLRIKRGQEKEAEKQWDAGLDQSTEGGSWSADDESSGTNLITKTQKKKKRGKQMVKGKEPPKVAVRRRWSDAEKTAVEKHLGNCLAERRVPRKEACLRAVQAEKALCQRSWRLVKAYVSNKIVTLNRRSSARTRDAPFS
ncbi:uncharacterized protein LOC115368320 [Myripristis murdjan]|uniref:uncharacterized protein LOC115368320 n=1 Tax=Myripristis murdjan TaxID=586833 RepID=UPI001175FD38|nr:uncharacterized protein LOC115368320 [Myripristis murdjan]